MNKRIAELLLQAAREAVAEEPTDFVAQEFLKNQTFAELIIQECKDFITLYGSRPYRDDVIKGIAEHFKDEQNDRGILGGF